MAVTAVIADDEKLSRDTLKLMLADIGDIEILAEVNSGTKALAIINELAPEIVFLDIQMPGLTGIEVAQQINTDSKIIFTTAYNEYQQQAEELGAVGYMLKPFNDQLFKQTVAAALKKISPN